MGLEGRRLDWFRSRDGGGTGRWARRPESCGDTRLIECSEGRARAGCRNVIVSAMHRGLCSAWQHVGRLSARERTCSIGENVVGNKGAHPFIEACHH